MSIGLLICRSVATMTLFACLAAFAPPLRAGDKYPAPPAPADPGELGKGIQRTMTLLATSTPEHRNKVRILFYGQSITVQVSPGTSSPPAPRTLTSSGTRTARLASSSITSRQIERQREKEDCASIKNIALSSGNRGVVANAHSLNISAFLPFIDIRKVCSLFLNFHS